MTFSSSGDGVPIANDDGFTVAKNSVFLGNVAGNDALSSDGGNVFSVVTQGQHGTASVQFDGTFTYRPVASYTGQDTFMYQITDANGDVSTATVTITIPGVAGFVCH